MAVESVRSDWGAKLCHWNDQDPRGNRYSLRRRAHEGRVGERRDVRCGSGPSPRGALRVFPIVGFSIFSLRGYMLPLPRRHPPAAPPFQQAREVRPARKSPSGRTRPYPNPPGPHAGLSQGRAMVPSRNQEQFPGGHGTFGKKGSMGRTCMRCSCGACGPVRADCVLATNIEVGNQMPTILPARSLAADL